MPRPKVLRERGAVLHVYIESSYAEVLEGVARREGKSVSALLREIVTAWLEGEARFKYGFQLALARDGPAGPPRGREDPLEELELEELKSELESLEREVGELARVVQQLQRLGWDAARSLHLPERYQLRERVYRKLKRWHSLRRLLRRLSQRLSHEELFALSSQMAEVKKRLNDLLAALG